MINDVITVIGGYDGHAYGEVIQIQLPEDICSLYGNRSQCEGAYGCIACDTADSKVLCYSKFKSHPAL